MRWHLILALSILVAGLAAFEGARAQTAPSEDVATERTQLFEALRTAPTESTGWASAREIWAFWMRQAPDEASTEMMVAVMDRRRQYDFAGAMAHLDRLVAHAPGWAEAWNQRATVLFQQKNYDRSLVDVEKVLALEPKHFGALAGKAIILMRQGRVDPGQKALREALAIHPWLSERRMLLPEAPGVDL